MSKTTSMDCAVREIVSFPVDLFIAHVRTYVIEPKINVLFDPCDKGRGRFKGPWRDRNLDQVSSMFTNQLLERPFTLEIWTKRSGIIVEVVNMVSISSPLGTFMVEHFVVKCKMLSWCDSN